MERLERTKEAGTREPGKSLAESPAGRASGAPFSPQPGNGSLEGAHYRQKRGARKGEGASGLSPYRHGPAHGRARAPASEIEPAGKACRWRAIHGNPPQRLKVPPMDVPAKPGHDGFWGSAKSPLASPIPPSSCPGSARASMQRPRQTKNLPPPFETAIFVPCLFKCNGVLT